MRQNTQDIQMSRRFQTYVLYICTYMHTSCRYSECTCFLTRYRFWNTIKLQLKIAFCRKRNNVWHKCKKSRSLSIDFFFFNFFFAYFSAPICKSPYYKIKVSWSQWKMLYSTTQWLFGLIKMNKNWKRHKNYKFSRNCHSFFQWLAFPAKSLSVNLIIRVE